MKRLICAVLLCLALTGCGSAPSAQGTVFAMDTVMELQLWGEDSELALARLSAVLSELEQGWSVNSKTSVAYNLNIENPLYQMNPSQASVVKQVLALSERTGGAFDPRLGAVSALWNFTAAEPGVPRPEALELALQEKQWDFGGAVKGFAGDRCVRELGELKIERAILNLGGNVQTYGKKQDGSPWRIGIQSPDGQGTVGVLSVEGTVAVVTSGDYQRCFEKDGIRYHHILDPQTGFPAQTGLRSVTVICEDGLVADALSTALFVMGTEKGIAHWQESDDFEAVFLLEDGSLLATQGAVLSECEYEVIRREK